MDLPSRPGGGEAASRLLERLMRAHAGRCVATIGTFDGVHAGHRRLVASASALARRRCAAPRTVAVTFSPRPEELFAGARPSRRCAASTSASGGCGRPERTTSWSCRSTVTSRPSRPSGSSSTSPPTSACARSASARTSRWAAAGAATSRRCARWASRWSCPRWSWTRKAGRSARPRYDGSGPGLIRMQLRRSFCRIPLCRSAPPIREWLCADSQSRTSSTSAPTSWTSCGTCGTSSPATCRPRPRPRARRRVPHGARREDEGDGAVRGGDPEEYGGAGLT